MIGAGFALCVVGGAIAATGVGAPAGAALCTWIGQPLIYGGAIISAVSSFIGIGIGKERDWAAFVYLREYKKEIAFANCTHLPVKQGTWWEGET